MNLREAILRLHELPEGGVLFVEPIGGTFRPESRVAILELSDEELSTPVSSVAALRAPGKEYFLEISVAREVIEAWKQNHPNLPLDDAQALESVIYYTVHDAHK
jgi:hypothetical protein